MNHTEKAATEEIWLLYYNRVLFERGVITERERNRMIQRILDRRGSAPV